MDIAVLDKDPLADFTPSRWETVKHVLSGNDPDGISKALAASRAGVPAKSLDKWLRRSRNATPADDPIIHEIAQFFDSVMEIQASRYEDLYHKRAVNGVIEKRQVTNAKGEKVKTVTYKQDMKALEKLLARRDPSYSNNPPKETSHELSPEERSEMMQKLIAAQRIEEADRLAEAEGNTIDIEPDADGVYG